VDKPALPDQPPSTFMNFSHFYRFLGLHPHRGWLLLSLAVACGASAQEPFTRQLTPDEFASAGLAKLSPEERARLDTLIRQHETGELARAREQAAAAEKARAIAETKATEAAARIAETTAPASAATPERRTGWLGKVLLKPGTAVEYETVETSLSGDFAGWSPGTLFTLSNGQRWRVTSGSYVTPRDSTPRKVRIVPGVLGSFFLEIEGIRSRPKVAFAGEAP